LNKCDTKNKICCINTTKIQLKGITHANFNKLTTITFLMISLIWCFYFYFYYHIPKFLFYCLPITQVSYSSYAFGCSNGFFISCPEGNDLELSEAPSNLWSSSTSFFFCPFLSALVHSFVWKIEICHTNPKI